MRKAMSGVVVGLALAAAAAAQTFTVTSPRSGESRRIGEGGLIVWEVSDPRATGRVDILLMKGETILGYITSQWPLVSTTTQQPPPAGLHAGNHFWWKAGEYNMVHWAENGTDYKILLRLVDGTEKHASGSFTIFDPVPRQKPVLKLEQPHRGETWRIGQNQLITWSFRHTSGPFVLELIREPEGVVETIARSLPATTGWYPWTVGELERRPGEPVPPGRYRVRVSLESNPKLFDDSDLPIRIVDGLHP